MISPDQAISVIAQQPAGLEILLTYDPRNAYLPPAWMSRRYEEAIMTWRERLSFECVRARPSRVEMNGNSLRMAAGPLSYSETRALHDCVVAYRAGSFGDFSLDEATNIPSASLVVSLLSDEGLMLLPRRSQDVATMAGLWAAGLGEGLEPVDFESGSLHAAVRRTLHEELAIAGNSVADASIKMLGVFQSTDSLSLTIFSVVDLGGAGNEFSAERLGRQAASAKDAWEHTELRFVEPNIKAVDDILASSEAGLCPGARTCLNMLAAYQTQCATSTGPG
jgi:hypothetical protein